MRCSILANYPSLMTSCLMPCKASTVKQLDVEKKMTYETFPENILQRIGAQLSPIDRLRLQSTCKRFRDVYAEWSDIEAVEIRCEDYGLYSSENVTSSRMGFQLPTKSARVSYHLKLTDRNGQTHRLRTSSNVNALRPLKSVLARMTDLKELTVWDACLPSELAGIVAKMDGLEILRLWNCSRYFGKTKQSSRMVSALLSRPSLKTLLVLDSSATACSATACRAVFTRSLAQKIRAPIENLQLVGVYLPLKSMEVISERLAATCKRLSIGCTFGKEAKRLLYLRALMSMNNIADLDLPPFIFNLNEVPVPDAVVQRLFDALPLKALGFRHYNSSVLFRFIEQHLPDKVRLLRVHHHSNRVPNFAQLGQEPSESPEKKSSVASRYSILSGSRSSIGSAEGISPSSSGYSSATRRESTCSSNVATTTVTGKAANGERKASSMSEALAMRRLTIFAITEERSNRRKQRLRKRNYSGVDVIYTQETVASQEILGRMASPMQSPHVYSRNVVRRADSRIRVIKGDLVKPIPLWSLGMESDYELSDWED